MIRLVIFLKNGEQVSGDYHWAYALSVLRAASKQDNYLDFRFKEAA